MFGISVVSKSAFCDLLQSQVTIRKRCALQKKKIKPYLGGIEPREEERSKMQRNDGKYSWFWNGPYTNSLYYNAHVIKSKCNTIRHFMFLLDIYYLDIASLLCLPWKVKTNFLPSSPRSRLVMKHLPPKIIAALYAAVLHVKRGMWNSFILQGAGLPRRTSIAFTFLLFFNSYFATSHIF